MLSCLKIAEEEIGITFWGCQYLRDKPFCEFPGLAVFWGNALTGDTLAFTEFLCFSSPGRSPGRVIVLPPALAATAALAKC